MFILDYWNAKHSVIGNYGAKTRVLVISHSCWQHKKKFEFFFRGLYTILLVLINQIRYKKPEIKILFPKKVMTDSMSGHRGQILKYGKTGKWAKMVHSSQNIGLFIPKIPLWLTVIIINITNKKSEPLDVFRFSYELGKP